MAVIIKGMEMPRDCKECGFRYRDGDIWRCKSTDERLRLTNDIRDCDCPLKSVEGLIEEIEHYRMKTALVDKCDLVGSCIDVIKKYCEVR